MRFCQLSTPAYSGAFRASATVLLEHSALAAIAAVREYGPDGCAAIIQGRLGSGDRVIEAGLVVQKRKPKVAAEAVAA